MVDNAWSVEDGIASLGDGYGGKILVDAGDVERVIRSGYRIRVSIPTRKYRVVNLVKESNSARKTISLGRFLLGILDRRVVFHVNSNPLDNTRGNLMVMPTIGKRRRVHTCEGGVIQVRSKKGVVLLDACDKWITDRYAVTVARRDRDGYLKATARQYGSDNNWYMLGRIILGAGPGQYVDHVNHNPLDNRRANLRLCSYEQNCWNTRPIGSSGYKGVCRTVTKTGSVRWRSQIQARGTLYRLGVYGTAEEAAKAYDEGAKRYHGEFAFLNFPEPTDQRSQGYPDSNQKTEDPTPTAPQSSAPCNP